MVDSCASRSTENLKPWRSSILAGVRQQPRTAKNRVPNNQRNAWKGGRVTPYTFVRSVIMISICFAWLDAAARFTFIVRFAFTRAAGGKLSGRKRLMPHQHPSAPSISRPNRKAASLEFISLVVPEKAGRSTGERASLPRVDVRRFGAATRHSPEAPHSDVASHLSFSPQVFAASHQLKTGNETELQERAPRCMNTPRPEKEGHLPIRSPYPCAV